MKRLQIRRGGPGAVQRIQGRTGNKNKGGRRIIHQGGRRRQGHRRGAQGLAMRGGETKCALIAQSRMMRGGRLLRPGDGQRRLRRRHGNGLHRPIPGTNFDQRAGAGLRPGNKRASRRNPRRDKSGDQQQMNKNTPAMQETIHRCIFIGGAAHVNRAQIYIPP